MPGAPFVASLLLLRPGEFVEDHRTLPHRLVGKLSKCFAPLCMLFRPASDGFSGAKRWAGSILVGMIVVLIP